MSLSYYLKLPEDEESSEKVNVLVEIIMRLQVENKRLSDELEECKKHLN